MDDKKKKGIIIGVVIVLVLAIGIGVFAKSKLDKIKKTDLDEDNLGVNEEMEEENKGYVNVALFGIDAHSKDATDVQSDAIVVASLNKETKEVKLLSVYGNAVITDDQNNAIAAKNIYKDGAESAVEMLNRNLDLDITHFVTVDFQALIDVIDAVGGIDIDVKEDEIMHITGYTEDLIQVTGKDSEGVSEAGVQTLNGTQAVAYCRIRATEGGDVARSERQKTVITKTLEKLTKVNAAKLNEIIDKVFPQVSTNFTITEMIAYAKDIAKYKLGDSMGFPDNNSFDMLDVVGSVVIPETLTSNVEDVHKFLFGDDGYTISSNITDIEAGIREKCTHKATSDSVIESDDDYGSGSGTSNDYSNSGSSNSNYNNSYNNNYNNSYNNSGSSGGTGSGSGTGDSGDGSDYGDYGGGSEGDYSGEDYN